jgi:hypothetical protein
MLQAMHNFTTGPYTGLKIPEVVRPDAILLSSSWTRLNDLSPLEGVKEGSVILLAKTLCPSQLKHCGCIGVNMDYDERFQVCADDSLRFLTYDDEELCYLLLGNNKDRNGIGLIIVAYGDAWRRAGQIQFTSWYMQQKSNTWSGLEKKEMLIR